MSRLEPDRNALGFTIAQLTGSNRDHVQPLPGLEVLAHAQVIEPFMAMRRAASMAGIDLVPVSAFRDFSTQVRIWNQKWTGQRPLLDRLGQAINVHSLAPSARVEALLIWSAAPGASRHHWGTEFDVYDRAAVPANYLLQLIPDEYRADGVFSKLTAWLDLNMHTYGFYRPYRIDRGGVQPEPWHLSHWPTANIASQRLRIGMLHRAIQNSQLEGKADLLALLPEVYKRYVRNVDRAPRRV